MKPSAYSLLLVFALARPSGAQEPCWGFGGGARDGVFIKQQFGAAVVRVQDVGTAYLIDSERGFLLTDGHVIDDLAAKNETNDIVLGTDPYTHYPFSVVKRLERQDVALLQLTQADALRDISPVDIALRALDANTTLFVMGYPLYGDQAKPFLRGPGAAKFEDLTPDGFIEINHVTSGGNSGGPLFDGFGDVVAISEQEIADGKVGRYLPLVSFSSLLERVPVSARMQKIQIDLVNGKLTPIAFQELLRRTDKHPSNLELYVWLQHLSSDSSMRTVLKPMLACPIGPAFEERGLWDALLNFLTDLPTSDAGKVQLSIAERDYALGRLDSAALSARSAAESFTTSGEAPLKALSLLVAAAVDERKGFFSDANKTYSSAIRLLPKPKDTGSAPITADLVATATQGLGRTSAGLGKTDLATKYYLNAQKGFAMSGNLLGQISAFQGIGMVKQETGDYQLAADSFSKALDLWGSGDFHVRAALLYQLSTVQAKLGKFGEASKNLTDATSLDPTVLFKTPSTSAANLEFLDNIGIASRATAIVGVPKF